MEWQLPVFWTVLLNAGAWLVIHLGVSWAATRLPARWLRPTTSWLFRQRRWEREGALYERLLAVHRWKRLLPDGAALFRRGFRKKRLLSRDPAYLRRFRVETARAELAHWVTMAFAPLFFLFNPLEVALFMPVYALLVNLPPIVAQRYNRCRFNEVLGLLEVRAAVRTASAAATPGGRMRLLPRVAHHARVRHGMCGMEQIRDNSPSPHLPLET